MGAEVRQRTRVFLTVLAILGMRPIIGVQGKNLKCACSTAQCVSRETRICTTRYKCYTQHLDKGDGSDPLTRGCVSGNTPIMCENFYPAVARSKWPLLSCCDDSDFCNEGPFSNPRPLSREHSTAGAKVYNTGEVLLRDLLNHTRFSSSNNGSAAVNKTHSVNQSVVLSVLFVGLFLLVAILAFGFYVLRKQSTYFKHHMCSILTEEDPSLLVLHSERRNTRLTSKQLQPEKLRCSET